MQRQDDTGVRLLEVTIPLLLVALVALAAVIATAGPAQAHLTLVHSSPATGAEVPLGTHRIALEFDEDLLELGSDVVVHGPGGGAVGVSRPEVSGSRLEARITLVTTGRHTLAYRVVGQDGHPVTGELDFTTVAGSPARPAAAGAVAPVRSGPTSGPAAVTPDRTLPRSLWLLPVIALGFLLLLQRGSRPRR